MSAKQESRAVYLERFEADRAAWTEALPEWLMEKKRAAAEVFAGAGFPDPRHEEWKYTNVRPIARKVFQPAGEAGTRVAPPDLLEWSLGELDLIDLVFVNGRFAPELSSVGDLPGDVQVRELGEALREMPERLENRLGEIATFEHSSFAAFNTAFVEQGAFIDVPAETKVDKPVRLLFVSTAEPEPVVCHPRVFVSAGMGAMVEVIEQYVGQPEAANFTNAVTEIDVADNARVEHYRIQRESHRGYHVAGVHVNQGRGSQFASHNINLGGRLARADINTRLGAEDAHAFLNGLFMPTGRQHMDTHTRIHHAAPHTTSEEVYRGVLSGHGRGVFKGRVLVAQDAQKIEAHQSNDNLLLSRDAEVDTKPELEIYADDVVCSHGATVGQLDEDALYYLQTRAINPELAQDLLTFAFADEVVARIPLKPVREQLEQGIVGRLPDNEKLKEFV